MSTLTLSRHRQIALFFTLVAVLLAAAFCLLRTGMETDGILVGRILALTVLALNGPFLLDRFGPFSSPSLIGAKTLLVLALGIAIALLGTAGVILLALLAIASLARNGASAWRDKPQGFALAAALGLAVLASIAIIADFAATKYTSAFSDQLVLYGRADGDVLVHAALINALHYFAVPSAGIDGIALAKYHYGLHAIVALLAESSAMGAVQAFSIFKAILLYPLTFCAALQCAVLLRPAADRPIGFVALVIVLAFVALIPPVETGYLASANSETAMFSGFLIMALLPAFHMTLTSPETNRARRTRALLIAACLVVPLSLFKLSAGYSWASAVFVWSLLAFGVRDATTWIAWGLAAVGGVLSVYLFSQTSTAELFGTPYFVEYGFAKGDYLLPLIINIGSLLVLALHIGRRWRRDGSGSSSVLKDPDFAFIAITLLLANLPGLFLDIESGNAGHFIVQQSLLALPFLVAALAAIAQDGFFTGRARGAFRWAGAAMALAILGFGLYGAGKKATADARAIISQRALIDTADARYYVSRKKRDLKADAARFVDEKGFVQLLSDVVVVPPARDLAAVLMAARMEFGNKIAVYVSPDVESFWNLTYDCDGKSLFTMTAAGLPMINGFPPCPPKFVYNGYPPVTAVEALDAETICVRARELGFPRVLVVGDLVDRSGDEILDCTAPNA